MSWFYKPYVPVAERRRQANKKIAALSKKGQTMVPVCASTPRGKIATSFWGQAWCDHLESYSDFANRLPRGRSYLRNGSVIHLEIESGKIHAFVMGSELYKQTVRIDPLPKAKWATVKKRCQGKIGSLVELLQGKLSSEIMAIVTDRKDGLFPSPREIHLDCSCPDWADLCKHLAAVLYGVGARLDTAPELLFTLRGVDHSELIQTDTTALVQGQGKGRRLASAALGDVFGIELDDDDTAPAKPARPSSKSTKPVAGKTTTPVKKAAKKAARKAAKKAARQATKQTGKKSGSQPAKKQTTRPTPFRPTGAAVRQLRTRLNLSRPAFAAQLGVSPASISNWEKTHGKLNLQAASLSALRKLHH